MTPPVTFPFQFSITKQIARTTLLFQNHSLMIEKLWRSWKDKKFSIVTPSSLIRSWIKEVQNCFLRNFPISTWKIDCTIFFKLKFGRLLRETTWKSTHKFHDLRMLYFIVFVKTPLNRKLIFPFTPKLRFDLYFVSLKNVDSLIWLLSTIGNEKGADEENCL